MWVRAQKLSSGVPEQGRVVCHHHFTGKPDLAKQAIQRSAGQIRDLAEAQLSGEGNAYERIEAYLLRKRDVLRGCPLGRLTHDPEILANTCLRQPLEETFDWLRKRLAEIIAEGQAHDDFDTDLDVNDVAATVASVVQGGYVLSKAANSDEPFHSAIRGMLSILDSRRKKVSG